MYREVTAIRFSRPEEQWRTHTVAIARRLAELASWSSERSCPRWRLIEAWSLAAHGPQMTAAGGSRLALWREASPRHGARLDRALVRYARCGEARPPGFPPSPVAAFAWFLGRHTAAAEGATRGMAYDVARFNELTKQMSAYAHITQAENAARAAARARRRAARTLAEQTNQRLRFRLSGDARVRVASELLDSDHPAHQAAGRRLYAAQQRAAQAQARDQRVRAGEDPWPLDGRYRTAVRYAEHWGLPTPSWPGSAIIRAKSNA